MLRPNCATFRFSLQFICVAMAGCSEGDAGLAPVLDAENDAVTLDTTGQTPNDTRDDALDATDTPLDEVSTPDAEPPVDVEDDAIHLDVLDLDVLDFDVDLGDVLADADVLCEPGATVPCYDGPDGTEGVGACIAGLSTCEPDGSGYGPCAGPVTPTDETCLTELDDDCDGEVNEDGEGCVCIPDSIASCYSGPEGTSGVGPCSQGSQTCNAFGTGYGDCTGDITPKDETCVTDADDDCDGEFNESGEGCVCVPDSIAPCYTGPEGTAEVGACTLGSHTCNTSGTGYGACTGDVTPKDETCLTDLDDDCDGELNESGEGCVCTPGSSAACYSGPDGTSGVGACVNGASICNASGTGLGACTGDVTPKTETCLTDVDDDCDGQLNESGEGCVCIPGSIAPCYSGPDGTAGNGACAAGTHTCNSVGLGYGECVGEITPSGESCLTDIDDDCDGQLNEEGEGCVCVPNEPTPCYTGPEDTLGIGVCSAGLADCNAQGTTLGTCELEVTPGVESCLTPEDDDCDGATNEEGEGCVCVPGTVLTCYTGAPGTESVGVCLSGLATCDASGTFYGPCEGEVTPLTETCESAADDDCDGSTFCPGAGETCTRPLYASDGVFAGGVLTFALGSGAVSSSEGPFACDSSGSGPDVAIEFEKTSASVKNGGKLLRVTASAPSSSTSAFVNLAVTQGSCQLGVTEPLKCLWYSQNWNAYIDGDPGTYTIWVAKNVAGTFGGATITIAEVEPASGEGEGCFAPYTTASANYTAPEGADAAHRWTLPAGLRSFDMGATWGEPQSISCDDTEPYGDIHGADAVIEGIKAQESTVLLVEVQNAGTSGSDLNAELLDQCDPAVPSKISRACSANADSHTFTAKPPVGPFYLWVSTEATGEPFEGASVRITEFAAAAGETRHTAVALPPSGLVTTTSAVAYDRPSCLGTSNVHWYAVTMTSNAVGIKTSTAVPIALVTTGGDEVACQADGSTARFGYLGSPGQTLYIALPSGQTTTVDVEHLSYGGVSGDGTDLEVTFPSSALTDYGMALGNGTLFLAGTSSVFEIPLSTGSTATQRGTTDGITSTHLGYDVLYTGGRLFSVDSTTSTSASRLFSIWDGTTWGPTSWDLTPSYAASSPSHAIATDGTSGFAVTRNGSSAMFYQFSLGAPNTPVLLGQTTSLVNASGLAADSQFFYVAATRSGVAGIYRVKRSAISDAPTLLGVVALDTTRAPLALDSVTAPTVLYVRDTNGDILAIVNPAGADATSLGAVVTLSASADYALTYDRENGVLYYFETESDSDGRIRMLAAP